MNYPHPLIAREGWPFLALAVAAAALLSWYSLLGSVPLWIVAIFVLQFFRDPARAVP
jgi:phosphatidylserine decarboxylase